MYEKFKILQAAAEQIGTIQNIAVHENDAIWGNCVRIFGATADGHRFDMEFIVHTKEADHE